MKSATAGSDRRLEIPGTARIVEGNGAQPKVRVASAEAAGDIYLLGANVTSWKAKGQTRSAFS